MKNSILCSRLLVSVSLAPAAPMTLSPYALSGSSESNGWQALTSVVYPTTGGFPGTTMWSPLGSSSGGDAELRKIANGPGGGAYAAGGSMYFGGFSSTVNSDGGILAVADSTPVAGLSNIVFQIQIGEAWTYDFHNGVLPVLSYATASGTFSNIAASSWILLEQYDNGTVSMPSGEETVYINTYALQWDLSWVGEPITDFDISFHGVQHAQVYALQLDQSDAYVQVVPEPGSAALSLLGGALVALRRRRGNR